MLDESHQNVSRETRAVCGCLRLLTVFVMIKEDKTLHILSYPYEDRKLICFYDDTELERLINNERYSKYAVMAVAPFIIGFVTLWIALVATMVVAIATGTLYSSGALIAAIVLTVAGSAGLVIKHVLFDEKFSYTKKCSFGDAANPEYIWKLGQPDVYEIVFPAGHPKNKVVYVGHPFLPNTYFPSFNFHRELFLQKYFEAIKILRSLGADEIEIHHVAGWAQDWASVAGVSLGVLEFRNNATGFNRSSSEIIGKFTYDPSGMEPKVPLDIIWFKTERAWQEIARARLEDKLREFDMSLTYEDDFGINEKFSGQVKGLGLELGGIFCSYERTHWRLHGKFSGL